MQFDSEYINLHNSHTENFALAPTVFEIFTFQKIMTFKFYVKVMTYNVCSGTIRWQTPDFLSDDNSYG